MRKYLSLLLLLVSVTGTAASEIFTDSGLVEIPTGAVLEHGIFGAGLSAAFQHNAAVSDDATAIRLNFGLFDRVEGGFGHTWNEPSTASFKLQLLKEQEVGAMPSAALGIEHRGTTDSEENSTSTFLAMSKIFNLPRIHQFSGHIGIGTQRFAFEERPIGLFVGVSKEFQPAFARGDITMSLEFDGTGANAGMRYITPSGLQIALGAETLNDPDALRYLVSVSWTNKHLLEQMDETRR